MIQSSPFPQELIDATLVGAQSWKKDSIGGIPAVIEEYVGKQTHPDDGFRLLLRAGGTILMSMAGKTPLLDTIVPTQALPELSEECPPKITQLLPSLVKDEFKDLLMELFSRLSNNSKRLPFHLLPLYLDETPPLYRSALLPLLGNRGKWLSSLNPSWSWVNEITSTENTLPDQETITTIWHNGNSQQRLEALAWGRRMNASWCLDLIGETFSKEKAEFRTDSINVLQTGLSPNDETFLEQVLLDRSIKVRRKASETLAQISTSRTSNTIRELVFSWSHYTPATEAKGLKKFVAALSGNKNTGSFTISLPETFDPEWQRFGIEEKAPQGIGPRAWWFVQMVSLVSPADWELKTGQHGEHLINAIAGNEWEEIIMEGWTHGALLFNLPGWIEKLWYYWQDKTPPKEIDNRLTVLMHEFTLSLLQKMPEEATERALLSSIKNRAIETIPWQNFIKRLPKTLSQPLGSAFVELLTTSIRNSNQSMAYYSFFAITPALFHKMTPSTLPAAQQTISKALSADNLMPYIRQQLDMCLQIITIRTLFQQEIPI